MATSSSEFLVWSKRVSTLLILLCVVAFMFWRQPQWQFPLLGAVAVLIGVRLYLGSRTKSSDSNSLSFWKSPFPYVLGFFLLFIAAVLTS